MKTLFDKIWNSHVVRHIDDGPDVLYIDRHYIHEVTSPQAFDGLRERAITVFRPQNTFATADHNIPTKGEITDFNSKKQLDTLKKNCLQYGIKYFEPGDKRNGIVHVIGPEQGLTLPGMTIVCGDSHTATHGAFGTIAFGIGTSEVEMVLATQSLLQYKPKTMRIKIEGKLKKGVTAKDIILYIISKLGTDVGNGYFIEYAGSTIEELSMEGRMTICNMSIEMGARGGLIAPDQKTFDYLRNREFAPKGKKFDKAVEYWKSLKTEEGAKFDKEYFIDAENIDIMITYGTNPSQGISIDGNIPEKGEKQTLDKSLNYMGFNYGQRLLGQKVDYVFIGSCTNGRIEDLRMAAKIIKGRKKADNVTVWVVPGSWQVKKQAEQEGLTEIFSQAGIEVRNPGCSACLAMNGDKVPTGKYCVSTSNRNFEGRQGEGARTLLASPLVAAAAAVTGKITNPNELI